MHAYFIFIKINIDDNVNGCHGLWLSCKIKCRRQGKMFSNILILTRINTPCFRTGISGIGIVGKVVSSSFAIRIGNKLI